MDAELQAYDLAWRETPKEDRNAVCQALADAYVLAHPELVAQFAALTLPECVTLVDLAREKGDEERRILLDVWIMAGFEFQEIGGTFATDGEHRPLPVIPVGGVARTPAEA